MNYYVVPIKAFGFRLPFYLYLTVYYKTKQEGLCTKVLTLYNCGLGSLSIMNKYIIYIKYIHFFLEYLFLYLFLFFLFIFSLFI